MQNRELVGSGWITQELKPVLWDNPEEWSEVEWVGAGREVQEKGDMCILTADSSCMAEANTTS